MSQQRKEKILSNNESNEFFRSYNMLDRILSNILQISELCDWGKKLKWRLVRQFVITFRWWSIVEWQNALDGNYRNFNEHHLKGINA